MQTASRYIALSAAVLALSACGDSATGPEPGPPTTSVTAFAVEIPDTVTEGQPFPLTVTALNGTGWPENGWRGSVTLSPSAGTLSPGSVELVNGTATVQATLSGHSGEVTIRAASGNVQSVAAATMVLPPVKRVELIQSYLLAEVLGGLDAPCRQVDEETVGDPRPENWQPILEGEASATISIDCSELQGSASAKATFQVSTDPATGWMRGITGTVSISSSWAQRLEWATAGPIGRIYLQFLFQPFETVRVRGEIKCTVDYSGSGLARINVLLHRARAVDDDCPTIEIADVYPGTQSGGHSLVAQASASSSHFFGPTDGAAKVEYELWLEFY